MAKTYTLNGREVTEAEYSVAIANMGLPPITDKARSEILGEPTTYSKNGFTGVDLPSGGTVVYRNPRRTKQHSGSGAGSAEFAATDPRRLDMQQPAGGGGDIDGPERDMGDVQPGAEPPIDEPAEVNISGMGDRASDDIRVRIRVPSDYLVGNTAPNTEFGGILFPYTPQITLEHKADYVSQSPMHSNYALNFYKSSSIPDISITGKFTVQNDNDAIIYVSTMQLLAALTKMRWGGTRGGDSDSGAPPPICRLDGYGAFMLQNVPVVITSFKHDLPDTVDFYTLRNSPLYGTVSLPTLSTFTITCKPTYSRAEILKFSVGKFLESDTFRKQGYL